MTSKQSDLLALKPATKKALAVLQKFAAQEKAFKELEVKKKEAETTLLEAMIANDIEKIGGDWGYITKATRKSYKGDELMEGVLDEILHFLASHPDTKTLALSKKLEFLKVTLDTAKVGAHVTLNGELPEGITQSETNYITKKFK